MNTFRNNGRGNGNGKFRRYHRWAGTTLVAFVLFLSITGIVLNHSSDVGLDRKYVSWSWLLDAYGLGKPEPYAGMVALGPLLVVADEQRAHVLLATGELVETLDLSTVLPSAIERIGVIDGRAVLESSGNLFRSDHELIAFEPWPNGQADRIEWSDSIAADTAELEVIETARRGPGLTVERVLLDLHSGRILSLPGRLLLDIVGAGLIILSVSGLVLSRRRRKNGNGKA